MSAEQEAQQYIKLWHRNEHAKWRELMLDFRDGVYPSHFTPRPPKDTMKTYADLMLAVLERAPDERLMGTFDQWNDDDGSVTVKFFDLSGHREVNILIRRSEITSDTPMPEGPVEYLKAFVRTK
jgi:hypothetical protein